MNDLISRKKAINNVKSSLSVLRPVLTIERDELIDLVVKSLEEVPAESSGDLTGVTEQIDRLRVEVLKKPVFMPPPILGQYDPSNFSSRIPQTIEREYIAKEDVMNILAGRLNQTILNTPVDERVCYRCANFMTYFKDEPCNTCRLTKERVNWSPRF